MTDRELIAQAEAFDEEVEYWSRVGDRIFNVNILAEHFKFRADELRAQAQAEQGEPVAHLVIIKTADAGETKFFTAPSDPRGFPVYRDSKASLRQVQKLLRGLSFKDAKITQALECIHRALEGDDQDQRTAAREELLADASHRLRVLKTMLKIEHLPGGAAAAERLIERIEAALGGST